VIRILYNINFISFSFEEQQIERAGLFPSFQQIEAFSKDLQMFENTKSTLSEIFQKFVSIAQLEGLYFIQKYDDFCYVKVYFYSQVY